MHKVPKNGRQDVRAELFLLLVRVQSWKERSEIPSPAVSIISVLYLVSITIHIYKVLMHNLSIYNFLLLLSSMLLSEHSLIHFC